MGWTGYYPEYFKNGKVDRKAELDDVFTWENEGRKVSVVKSSMVGTVYYAAVRIQNEAMGLDKIIGAVALTQMCSGEFRYKDMEESMLPYYFDCPVGILNLLTPTDNENANEWRRLCRERREKKKEKAPLPVGTVIEFRYNGKTVRAYKHAPAFQFKRPFWMRADGMAYIPHTRIPDDFKVVA